MLSKLLLLTVVQKEVRDDPRNKPDVSQTTHVSVLLQPQRALLGRLHVVQHVGGLGPQQVHHRLHEQRPRGRLASAVAQREGGHQTHHGRHGVNEPTLLHHTSLHTALILVQRLRKRAHVLHPHEEHRDEGGTQERERGQTKATVDLDLHF